MKKIILRADSSPEIGLGHLYRIISLAHILSDHFDCLIATNDISKIPEAELKKLVISVIQIAAGNYSLPDEKANNEEVPFDMEEMLSGNEIVIIDGYWFGTEYQKRIKKKGCILVCIDDLCDKEYFADLIINHAPGLTSESYHAQPYTKFALGPDYAILRPAFLKQAKALRTIKLSEGIFICFGGSDYLNLTKTVLQVVIDLNYFKKIDIVLGSSFVHKKNLIEMAMGNDAIKIHENLNEETMLETMLLSDLAIVPASSVLYEVMAAGCKSITGYYSLNQKLIYNGFVEKDAVFGCGDFSNLKKDLERFFEDYNDWKPQQLIDGLSGTRILGMINNLVS